MKKNAFIVTLLFIVLVLAGCGGVYKPFELMDDRTHMKSGYACGHCRRLLMR